MSATLFDGTWELTPADRLLVEAKRWGSRLRFAVMLLFYRARGRFPRAAAEVDKDVVAVLARTLGFREATVADAEDLGAWLRDTVVARTRDVGEITAEAEARCRALRIEPPAPDRLARLLRAAVRAHDDRRFAAVHARLAPELRAGLNALLPRPVPRRPAPPRTRPTRKGKRRRP